MFDEKKAIVIGGSNGIGLSIVKNLMLQKYHVIILDISEPDSLLNGIGENYEYHFLDLLDYEEKDVTRWVNDESVNLLMITAGFGRVADFVYLHPSEIRKLLLVNTVAGIEIIRLFYDRIKSKSIFYCGMMGSIAGLVSSPMFSVYAASKAAICRFVESVNVELEALGTQNRILNVSPGSIKGTRFNGADSNQEELTNELAVDIINNIYRHEQLFIPEYNEIYKGVIERYNNNPSDFGRSSYEYKINSGRVVNKEMVRIGYLSGTFDLFHIGHLNLLKRAKSQCDYLIVGVHPSASHKGKEAFIPLEERKQIVSAVKYVDKVVDSCVEDADAWSLYKYNRLFVGSDYKGTERFNKYEEYFKDKNVEIIYFPYTEGTSSTQIRNRISEGVSVK